MDEVMVFLDIKSFV